MKITLIQLKQGTQTIQFLSSDETFKVALVYIDYKENLRKIYEDFWQDFFHIFNVLVLILLVYFPGLYTAPENMEYDMKTSVVECVTTDDLENYYCLFWKYLNLMHG